MAITKEDKQIIQKALQSIDVKKLYEVVEADDKRKWFRFGAYDALRMVAEMIESYPEHESTKVGINIVNPNE